MKPLLNTFSFLFLLSAFTKTSFATTPFTILAESGLNVRAEPNINSARIASLPFGTVVESESYLQLFGEKNHYIVHPEVIEGKRGTWIKIHHGNIEGYIFSGFGLFGDNLVTPESDINKEYRLMRPGPKCANINYDPRLHWYGLVPVDGKLTLRKCKVHLRLMHEYTSEDTLGYENQDWRFYPLKVQTSIQDTVYFLFGSKRPLQEGLVDSRSFHTNVNADYMGKFLFPEEKFEHFLAGNTYTFRAFEDIDLDTIAAEGYNRQYQIELIISPGELTYNLSKELDLHDTGKKYSNAQKPKLVWAGDLNGDGILDFIYYTSDSFQESCGTCGLYFLFMSDSKNADRWIRKVASMYKCSCIT